MARSGTKLTDSTTAAAAAGKDEEADGGAVSINEGAVDVRSSDTILDAQSTAAVWQ